MPTHFLSCDWGTTNFRLRLATADGAQVLAEAESDKGVSNLQKTWKEGGVQDEAARLRFYTDVLRDATRELQSRAGQGLQNLPVVISGMASSTLGLINLPYQSLPVPVDGSGFRTHRIGASEDFPHDILLISGLQHREQDVMRGEETQLVGCLTPEMETHSGDQLIIHPGTHAKHITVSGGEITGFKTFMTGEFFKILSTHGILRDNVVINGFSDAALSPFEQGVQASLQQPLLHAAFRVRTNDLFARFSKEENYHYLSGLLIGTELQTLRDSGPEKKYLCAGPSLHAPYTAALRVLGLDEKVKSLPPEWEEGSVVRGQAKVLAVQKGL